MAGKIKEIKNELSRQLKMISVSFTVAVHLLYIGYLSFAMKNDIGNKYVNIALAVATAVFLLIYLIFRLFGSDRRNVKRTKKVYKRFKLLMKLMTVVTAVYTIFTAVGSVSPVAVFFAAVNAVVLSLRLLFELIASLIGRGARKVKARFSEHQRPETVTEYKEPESVETCEISLDDL